MSTTATLEARIAALTAQNAELKEQVSNPVSAAADAYVSKKGEVVYCVRIKGDFYPISLNLERARDVAAISKQIIAAADDCEARKDELGEMAVRKYEKKLAS